MGGQVSEQMKGQKNHQLSIRDHSRDSAGLRYVYPVVSRRAGGVSLGINLNVNNACNWACVYCQVPGLTRGGPPPVDLDLLESELRGLLADIVQGDYLARHVPEGVRRLVDIAFSGNGEPTAAPEFAEAVGRVLGVMGDLLGADGQPLQVPLRLITNGSLLHRSGVRRGVALLGAQGGEVWFKFDRATAAGVAAVNGARMTPLRALGLLARCADLAPTWVQTCFFAVDGVAPSAEEGAAYLAALATVKEKIKGVHLYGLARPSMQIGAERLSSLSLGEMEMFAAKIAEIGIRVVVNP